MVRFVLVTLRAILTCKFELNTAILDFDRFEVSKNPDFSQLVRETSNGAFCVTYAESSLTCKFELNTAILDFDRFQVSQKSDFSQVVPETSNGAFYHELRREQA